MNRQTDRVTDPQAPPVPSAADPAGRGEPLFPVNLRLAGRRCLVVGGGTLARRKIEALLEVGADVRVVAPEIHPAIEALPGVSIERRRYRRGELAGERLVVTATGDPEVDGAVFEDGEACGVWVNAADDPEHCAVTLPARIRRGPLLVTVSTSGQSPAVATWLRRRLEDELGPEYEALLRLVADVRGELRSRGVATEGLAWQDAIDSGMLELVREGNLAKAKERLQACLSSSSA
ncbi:MAG: bifunctional precorrin-2 dehydrogenase/sirohydrochlorin ferrochelatase [Actinobacteria bacterium]|nr:bifunctional precorrin-2 dehydrogenase/sirohydrochlorin ferrochelatase [Actinomycetota bacterium]